LGLALRLVRVRVMVMVKIRIRTPWFVIVPRKLRVSILSNLWARSATSKSFHTRGLAAAGKLLSPECANVLVMAQVLTSED